MTALGDSPEAWASALNERLPRHARLAGRDVVEALARRLSRRRAQIADGPAPLADLLRALWTEHRVGRAAVEEVEAALRAARAVGLGDRPVPALLRRLHSLGHGPAPRLGPWLDGTAVDDRVALAAMTLDQPVTLLATALGSYAVGEAAAHLELADPLLDLASQPDLPWTLAVAALAALRPVLAAGRFPPPRLVALARDRDRDPWVQAAALERIADLAPALAVDLGARELDAVHVPGDHRFVRARAAALLGRLGAFDVLRTPRAEPSEHARAATDRALAASPGAGPAIVVRLRSAGDDWRAAVAGAVAHLDAGHVIPAGLGAALAALPDAPARTLLDAVWRRLRASALAGDPRELERALPDLRRPSRPEDLRRLATAAARWLRLTRTAPDALAQLDVAVTHAREGATLRFRTGPVADLNPDELLDALYALATDDLDLSARPLGPPPTEGAPPRDGWEVHVGLATPRAAWRIAHELRTPRNNKRPAFLHTVDEVPRGGLVAWSARMAEVAATEVPGRRVASTTTTGWDEHLPLPANLLTAARHGAVHLRTPGGDIIVRAVSRGARLRAHAAYVDLARLRERLHGRPVDEATATWDAAAREAGFAVERRLASLATPLSLVGASGDRSAWELGLLSAGALGGWAVATATREAAHRRWRSQLGLVIGGWGSRGKSSVERMKAALFHGLGYKVLCKSTGCEAMLLSAIPGRPAVETFLYRPRDKATIVEQRQVLRHAATFGAQVTLYECMALNPQYTHILQHAWMRDDLTTLTNTYPDHEDIQGPSGRDVADVISVFVPDHGALVTSEQHMTPVLARRARALSTDLHTVGPEAWDLLPRDLLDRFPDRAYDRNVALVARLATALDVPVDVAIRAMADHLLVDLGAFKRYGPLPVAGRRLVFWNGCSANDRASFLSNWDRAGLEDHPGPLAVVFNNRADRLARQAIFARIAALDVAADRVFLIGTNVGPMRDAITAAFTDELRPRWLGLARADRAALVAEARRRLRLPADADDARLTDLAAAPDPTAAIDAVLAALAARVVPIFDPKASGDALLDHIAAAFPPGSEVTLLGAENIKGTGLDFVYRWLSADRVLACLARLDGPPHATRAALRELSAWDSWGRHDAALAVEVLTRRAPALDGALRDDARAALGRARAALDPVTTTRAGWLDRLRAALAPLRLLAAIHRRRTADALFDAAARGHVGLERAAREARALVDAEKAS
jgi:poly-gamma-glutamate synthase PgsB/CapB